ncbi:MAG: hypothetical protein JWL69_4381 [Phycisphaerales bacterium]|jgi:hypothetical protein|nr:hypothetical protein [Phycisphaerales bacterium]MDB5355058.1 hypothetical protein [Phycisphaerales bacterium]
MTMDGALMLAEVTVSICRFSSDSAIACRQVASEAGSIGDPESLRARKARTTCSGESRSVTPDMAVSFTRTY